MKTRIIFVILSLVSSLLGQDQQNLNISNNNNTVDSNTRRIFYGINANPENYPFLVRLASGNILCAGSIIHHYFVLTAAHCTLPVKCEAIKIYPSTWMRGNRQTIYPAECYIREEYRRTKLFYDIALIRTKTNILEDKNLKIIPLPEPGTHYAAGTPAVIVGWGKIENRTYPGKLLQGNVFVVSWDACDYIYKHAHFECISDEVCPVLGIPKRSFCTQGPGLNPSGTCHGDSGGPVIINNILAGVITGVLLINKECRLETPSMHTSVPDYLWWIYSIIEPDKDIRNIPVIDEFHIS